ncbi:hypothetical protein LTR86_003583 [Recurvomyces mirabilis]|nr:hypothetical protein LTR86_003583 [Recurvomyces mirabilis]
MKLSGGCFIEIVKVPSCHYTAQTVVQQILSVLGENIKPSVTQEYDHIPTELLRTAFEKVGHVPFFESFNTAKFHLAGYQCKPASMSYFCLGMGAQLTTK